MTTVSTYYLGQPVRYIGPRPGRDVPKWMDDPCSFRKLHDDGEYAEVFTTNGTEHIRVDHIAAK